ncbi:MAG: hypothetical protein HGB04_03895 [Chlorobiaceae bacterium]|nr:hypothetical protein [Chlorobiaceae bacterium]
MDLLHQYHQLEERIIEAGGVLDDELEAALAGSSEAIEKKLDGYTGFINYCKGQAEYLKSEAEAFTARAKTLLNAVDGMRQRMIFTLQSTGNEKLKTEKHSYSLRTSASWVLKDDLSSRILKKIEKDGLGAFEFKPDIKAIKDRFKDDHAPEYIEIIPKVSINIR